MDLLRFMVMPSVFLFLIPLYVVKVEAEDDASIRLELAKRIDDQNLFGYWSSAGTWGSAFCNEPRTASCALTLEIQSPYLGCWCANEVPVLSKVSCIDRSLILVAGLTKAFINTPWTLCSTALIYENVGDEMPEYIAVECFIQLGITYYRNLPTSQLSSKSLGSTTNSITAATAATTATTLKVLSITADTAATTTITSGVLSILTITSYVPSYIYAIPSQSSSLSSTSQPQAADATNHNEVGLGVGLGLGFSAIALGALAWLFYVLKRRYVSSFFSNPGLVAGN